jgi:predicted DNA-binding transcriptional regulator AlpA
MANRRHTKKELKALRAKRQADRDAVYQFENPDQVLSFPEWVRLVGLSRDAGYRLLHSGGGPRLLRLGIRRIGIRLSDHRGWLDRLAKEAS